MPEKWRGNQPLPGPHLAGPAQLRNPFLQCGLGRPRCTPLTAPSPFLFAEQQLETAGRSRASLAALMEKPCRTSTAADSTELFPSGLLAGVVSQGACGRDQKLAPMTAALDITEAAGL